jgi:hypothetical protein
MSLALLLVAAETREDDGSETKLKENFSNQLDSSHFVKHY